MRCKCCDAIIDNPKFNKQLNDWELCTVCLEIVFSVFEDYPSDEEEIVTDKDEIEEALDILDREEARVKPLANDLEFSYEINTLSFST